MVDTTRYKEWFEKAERDLKSAYQIDKNLIILSLNLALTTTGTVKLRQVQT